MIINNNNNDNDNDNNSNDSMRETINDTGSNNAITRNRSVSMFCS